MYRLTNSDAITRLADNAYVPADPGNTDYQTFRVWVAAGNTPQPIPAPTTVQLAAQARADRDSRLASTDWLVSRHRDQQAAATATTLTAAQYSVLLSYRQALRDVPAQAGFPTAINWPVKP